MGTNIQDLYLKGERVGNKIEYITTSSPINNISRGWRAFNGIEPKTFSSSCSGDWLTADFSKIKTELSRISDYNIGGNNVKTEEQKQDELLKFIEENEVEHDEENVYMYLVVDLEGKSHRYSEFNYKKCGFYSLSDAVYTLIRKDAVEKIKDYSKNVYVHKNEVINTNFLYEINYKIIKVKINKKDLLEVCGMALKCNKFEVISEETIENSFEFEVLDIESDKETSIQLALEGISTDICVYETKLKNTATGNGLILNIYGELNISQEDIKKLIVDELERLNKIFNQKQNLKGKIKL